MPTAILLYFDPLSEQRIRGLWQQLARDGVSNDLPASGIRPHLTLAVFDKLDCLPCEKVLARFAQRTRHLDLSAAHFGVFYQPEVTLFLAPTPTGSLLDFHAALHRSLKTHAHNSWQVYQPDSWVPHCTLAMNLSREKITPALASCSSMALPVALHATQIAAADFLPLTDLFRYDLMEE